MGSEWIFGWLGGCGLDSTGSGQGPVAGCCGCGDEPSGSCATQGLEVYLSRCFFAEQENLFFILPSSRLKNVIE
jgi:hypothetical protein